jgi:hypothetical protein
VVDGTCPGDGEWCRPRRLPHGDGDRVGLAVVEQDTDLPEEATLALADGSVPSTADPAERPIGTRLAGLLLTVAGAATVAGALALYWANSGYYGAGEDWTGSAFLEQTANLALLLGIVSVNVGIVTTLAALVGVLRSGLVCLASGLVAFVVLMVVFGHASSPTGEHGIFWFMVIGTAAIASIFLAVAGFVTSVLGAGLWLAARAQAATPVGVAPPPLPPADWYTDPADGRGRRYWDGARWTQFTADGASPTATRPTPNAI